MWDKHEAVNLETVCRDLNAGCSGSHTTNSSSSRNRLFRNPARPLSASDCFLIGCRSCNEQLHSNSTRQRMKCTKKTCSTRSSAVEPWWNRRDRPDLRDQRPELTYIIGTWAPSPITYIRCCQRSLTPPHSTLCSNTYFKIKNQCFPLKLHRSSGSVHNLDSVNWRNSQVWGRNQVRSRRSHSPMLVGVTGRCFWCQWCSCSTRWRRGSGWMLRSLYCLTTTIRPTSVWSRGGWRPEGPRRGGGRDLEWCDFWGTPPRQLGGGAACRWSSLWL